MRRFARWTLNTLTALSLLMCVLWARSYWRCYEASWYWQHPHAPGADRRGDEASVWWVIGCRAGRCYAVRMAEQWEFVAAADVSRRASRWRFSAVPLGTADDLRTGTGFDVRPDPTRDRLGFQVTHNTFMADDYHAVAFPLWCVVVAIAPAPVARVFAVARRRWRARHRRCPCCSYDLTGNVSGVCPGCGTTVMKETA